MNETQACQPMVVGDMEDVLEDVQEPEQHDMPIEPMERARRNRKLPGHFKDFVLN